MTLQDLTDGTSSTPLTEEVSNEDGAFATRAAKVSKGAGRQVVLRVKPRARGKLAKRRRILVRQAVRAGKTRATLYQQRKLIRR